MGKQNQGEDSSTGGDIGVEEVSASAATEEKPADDIPAYQRADYNGPLTIPQAQWRLRNIKPVTGARTK